MKKNKIFIGYALTSKEFFDSILVESNADLGIPTEDGETLEYTWCREHPITPNEYVLSYWKDDVPIIALDLLKKEIKKVWGKNELFTYDELEPDGWFPMPDD